MTGELIEDVVSLSLFLYTQQRLSRWNEKKLRSSTAQPKSIGR